MPQDWQACRFGAVLQGEQALNTACLQLKYSRLRTKCQARPRQAQYRFFHRAD